MYNLLEIIYNFSTFIILQSKSAISKVIPLQDSDLKVSEYV